MWAVVLPAALWARMRRRADGLPETRGVAAAVAAWLAGFCLLSLAQHPAAGREKWPLLLGMALDVAGVALLVCAVARATAETEGTRFLQRCCVAAAVLAAVVSVFIFYGLNGGVTFGARLRNWFVHGGQHPVPTAITFGFAALWAGLGLARSANRAAAWGWGLSLFGLNVAVAFSQSRGASLALLAATVVLALVVRRKRAWFPLAFVLLALGTFHFLSPHLAERARLAKLNPGQTVVPASPATARDARVPPNGLKRWVERGDAGRFNLYQLLLRRQDGPADLFFGKGWTAAHSGERELGWPATHPHSVLVSTYYHGGQFALVGLIFFLAFLFARAVELWRAGLGVDCLVLLCYGCVALTFDGESLTTIFTEPRFESLVFWVPVGLVAGRCRRLPAALAAATPAETPAQWHEESEARRAVISP